MIQSALYWQNEGQVVHRMLYGLPGWSHYSKNLNLFGQWEWVCTDTCFASCSPGAFDLSSLKPSGCGTAWWLIGACDTNRHHSLFGFIVSKDPVRKLELGILQPKISEKATEFPMLSSTLWPLCFGFLLCASVYIFLPGCYISEMLNI